MLNIFLSYARRDGSGPASRLRTELTQAGFNVWRDVEEMHGGKSWKEQLRGALRNIDVLLILLTPAAVESHMVTWEWENALTLERKVIPLLLINCKIPPDLAQLHYHDLSTSEKYSTSLMALMRDLNLQSEVKGKDIEGHSTNDRRVTVTNDFYQPDWKVGTVIQNAGGRPSSSKENRQEDSGNEKNIDRSS